jgi:aspartyl protease family protein
MVTTNASALTLLLIALTCIEGAVSSQYFVKCADRREFAVDAIAATVEDEEIRTKKSPDGLFYVTARVKSVPIRFLVDTGANLVVLTPEDARSVGLALSESGAKDDIETAGGTSQMNRVVLDQVSLAGHEFSGIDAAVVHGGLRVSLLGQNMLARLGPITLSGDELRFSPPR